LLEQLLSKNPKTEQDVDDIDTLTLFIRKWDEDHSTFKEANPVQLLLGLMDARRLKAKDMVPILGIGKSVVSEILNFKKALSKEVIRKLAAYFSLPQEAFNRSYQLVGVKQEAQAKKSEVETTVLKAKKKRTRNKTGLIFSFGCL
jgi:HTH-type transcriptional regulator/antitoxin HigA